MSHSNCSPLLLCGCLADFKRVGVIMMPRQYFAVGELNMYVSTILEAQLECLMRNDTLMYVNPCLTMSKVSFVFNTCEMFLVNLRRVRCVDLEFYSSAYTCKRVRALEQS